MSPGALPNLIATGLLTGSAVFITLRRPPAALWPTLLLYQIFALLYIVGDTITLGSHDLWTEQVGIAVSYSGSLPAAAVCWLLAVHYAEAQGRPIAWARGARIAGPVAAAGIAWLVMISNPWHGQFLTPVIGDHSRHHWAWYALVPPCYALVSGSVVLYATLAWRERDEDIRRNAAIMGGGILLTLIVNFVSYVGPVRPPFDLTVAGLGATSVFFLYGAHRSRMFSLLADVEGHSRMTVLVVDDDEAVLELTQEYLERASFTVIAAGGGEEALRIFRQRAGEIDVVVLDLSMPDVDGEQTFQEIRRHCPGARVILVSGYSEEMAAERFAAANGAEEFLSKPYSAEEIVERIQRALAR